MHNDCGTTCDPFPVRHKLRPRSKSIANTYLVNMGGVFKFRERPLVHQSRFQALLSDQDFLGRYLQCPFEHFIDTEIRNQWRSLGYRDLLYCICVSGGRLLRRYPSHLYHATTVHVRLPEFM